MKPTVEKSLTIGITLAIAIVIAIVFLSIRQFRSLRETGARVRETNEVLFNTETILAASVNCQLMGEDFLLTGDSSFLDSFRGWASLLHTTLSDLKRLTVDDRLQQKRIDSNKQQEYKDCVTPDLILLDINLPKMDGMEVLSIIKKDYGLRRVPVIMLTTSSAEMDIIASYDNHANCYITKPVDLERFMNVVRTIEDFWISIVKLPKTVQ